MRRRCRSWRGRRSGGAAVAAFGAGAGGGAAGGGQYPLRLLPERGEHRLHEPRHDWAAISTTPRARSATSPASTPSAGFNPGFNGGVNPNFGNSSGMNTNFGFNPYNGLQSAARATPPGISGFSGTPFGSNALLNNPFNPNGLGIGNTLGSNPLITSPINTSNGLQNGLGSNAADEQPGQRDRARPDQQLHQQSRPVQSREQRQLLLQSGHRRHGASPFARQWPTGQRVQPHEHRVRSTRSSANNGFNTFIRRFGSGYATYGGGLPGQRLPGTDYFDNGISTDRLRRGIALLRIRIWRPVRLRRSACRRTIRRCTSIRSTR